MNIMKKNNLLEITVFICFCFLTIFLSCFHEMWLDEFQSWGISKDSLYNILFIIPHNEGHPPLWHLILKLFSSLNINAELGLRIPNFLFIFSAIWLLVFKSPFHRSIRLLLPFTYFLFYQYAIISRPYSIFAFAIFLSAVFYKTRNENPFKLIFALILLCLSSAYGIIFASGICIAWFIEIINKQNFMNFIKTFVKDSRFKSMLLLFIVCLILIAEFLPTKNTSAVNHILQGNDVPKFIYSFLGLIADTTIFDFYNYSSQINQNAVFYNPLFYICCLLGLIINILLISFFKRYNKFLLFFIPYFLFCLFSGLVYCSAHHIGLLFIFLIFVFWCTLDEENISIQDFKNEQKLLSLFILFTFLIQIYWSCSAFKNELLYQYTSSKQIAQYIKQNNLDKYKIMAKWSYIVLSFKRPLNKDNTQVQQANNAIYLDVNEFNMQRNALEISSYIGKNIFYNFNMNNPDKLYIIFKFLTNEEQEKYKEKIKKYGLPEVIVGKAKLEYIFTPEELQDVGYVLVKNFEARQIFKSYYTNANTHLYIRQDIYEKLNH